MVHRFILDNHVESHRWLYKSLSLLICYWSTIMSCFRIFIITDKAVGTPVHGKDIVDGLNDRYKHMLKLDMVKIFNTESICDYPRFSS